MKKQYILDKLEEAFHSMPIFEEVLEYDEIFCEECEDYEYSLLQPICEGMFFGDIQRAMAIEEVDDIWIDPWESDDGERFIAVKIFLTEKIEDWEEDKEEEVGLLN